MPRDLVQAWSTRCAKCCPNSKFLSKMYCMGIDVVTRVSFLMDFVQKVRPILIKSCLGNLYFDKICQRKTGKHQKCFF